MADRNPLKLEAFLPYRLSLLSNTVSSAIAAAYHDKFSIDMPEWRLIMVLAEYPGSSAEEVCRKTRMEKSVVSRAVARLLERHLLVRNFDQTDRRRSILVLTATGRSVYNEVTPVATDYGRRLLDGLNRKERAALDRLLEKLQTTAERLK